MDGDENVQEIEHVPGEDTVNRHVYRPYMYKEDVIDPRQAFMFPKKCERRRESVIWRRYVRSIEDVHALGCEKEARDNSSREPENQRRYMGCLESLVGRVRAIVNTSGHGFSVDHAPEEGVHHVHIEVRPVDGMTIDDVTKTEMNDLRDEIYRIFAPLIPYSC